APGFALGGLVINGVNYFPAFDGQSSFTIPNVQQAQNITADFRKAPGQSCGGTAECASGYCVSGLCCNTACTGGCESCNVPGSEGSCSSACGAFACDSAQNMCRSSCASNDDCVPGG